ncbi:MAG: OadG family protein [Propionibacteriaceae bacterium]|nr:OadG family protein [Propionibacteriaceae bacterium]
MENLTFGLWVTGVGMGTVLAILVALMLLLYAIGWLDQRPARRLARRLTTAGTSGPGVTVGPGVTLTEEEFAAAALAVAIHSAKPARPDHVAKPARSGRATGARSTGGWIATGRGRRTRS